MNKQTKRDIIGAVSATLTFVLVVSLLAWVATAEAGEAEDGLTAAIVEDFLDANKRCLVHFNRDDLEDGWQAIVYYKCMGEKYDRKAELSMEKQALTDGVRM